MLERYFQKPQTIERVRACWICELIERYVVWLTENGYAISVVLRRVPILMRFGRFAQAYGAKNFNDLPQHVRAFAEAWQQERSGHCCNECTRQDLFHDARNPVEQMLCLALPDYAEASHRRNLRDPFVELAPGFFAYLRDERGLQETTIRLYRYHLGWLESYCQQYSIAELRAISTVVLRGFLTTVAPRCKRADQLNLCGHLKVFFRYLLREGLLCCDRSVNVDIPRTYRLAEIPRHISWEEVRRMFEAVDRRTISGKRDYAILLLLVTYGLRAGELAKLTLDDIDWKHERLRIAQRKAGHSSAYPLSTLVGNAIIEYLQHGRPQTEDRHLFFCATAPRRPIGANVVQSRASYYLRKAGIAVARLGSHTLRHSCVQRLVDAQFHVKSIGDYVGHAHPASTNIYAKINVEALRVVALGDGEDIL